MLTEVSGLVIRETKVGECDKLITLLTEEYGLISVSAKGSKNLKSRFLSGTQPFSYGKFTLFYSKGKYSLNEVELTDSFFDLRTGIEELALGQYFCELASCLAPENEECRELLSLTLNALHILSKRLKPAMLVKSVFELRALSVQGFAPDLVACGTCAVFEHKRMYFSPSESRLWCGDCFDGLEAAGKPSDAAPLSPSVLYAMRFILYSESKKIFSFKMEEKELCALSEISEKYVLSKLERSFNSLEFYNTVKD